VERYHNAINAAMIGSIVAVFLYSKPSDNEAQK